MNTVQSILWTVFAHNHGAGIVSSPNGRDLSSYVVEGFFQTHHPAFRFLSFTFYRDGFYFNLVHAYK